MKCPNCSHENQAWRKFCGECGRNLVCPRCKAINLDGGNYCGECGEGTQKVDHFTSEGEEISYVSVESAGLNAIQAALQDREQYRGHINGEVEHISFTVGDVREEEEHFYITIISSQPVYPHMSGIESIIMDKSGHITLRQIIEYPRGRSQPY